MIWKRQFKIHCYYFKGKDDSMVIHGRRFSYGGVSLTGEQTLNINMGTENPAVALSSGLRFLYVNTEEDDRIHGEITTQSIYIPASNRRFLTDVSRENSPMTREVEILSEEPIRPQDERALEKFLFSRRGYRKLEAEKSPSHPMPLYPMDDRAISSGSIFTNGAIELTLKRYLQYNGFVVSAYIFDGSAATIVSNYRFFPLMGTQDELTARIQIPLRALKSQETGYILYADVFPSSDGYFMSPSDGFRPFMFTYNTTLGVRALGDAFLQEEYINCIFLNPTQVIYSDGLHGWRCTMETDSEMAHLPEKTTFSSGAFPNQVIVDTDISGYTWPDVSFTFTPSGDGDGSVRIINLSDNDGRAMTFSELPSFVTIKMNGKTKRIQAFEAFVTYGPIDISPQANIYPPLSIQLVWEPTIGDYNWEPNERYTLWDCYLRAKGDDLARVVVGSNLSGGLYLTVQVILDLHTSYIYSPGTFSYGPMQFQQGWWIADTPAGVALPLSSPEGLPSFEDVDEIVNAGYMDDESFRLFSAGIMLRKFIITGNSIENINDYFRGRNYIRLIPGANNFSVSASGSISNVSISYEPMRFMSGVTQ